MQSCYAVFQHTEEMLKEGGCGSAVHEDDDRLLDVLGSPEENMQIHLFVSDRRLKICLL